MVKHWRSVFFVLGLVFFSNVGIQAQTAGELAAEDYEKIKKLEDTLAIFAFTVINDSLPEERFGACREMIPMLVRALKTENSFRYPFGRLTNVSIQYPRDSSFRVFTWQLYVDENDYRYFGAIQMNVPELRLYPLIDRSFNVEDPEHAVLSHDNWYGAVYYNLKEVDGAGGKYYLLFGFDGFEFFRKRKVMDVLSFAGDGQPVFGAPIIPGGDAADLSQPRSRLCLEYSAGASIRLNYDAALDLIVFDHLIAMDGQHGEGPVNIPDGSYEAFRIEQGMLVYVDKVWDQIQEEPPRPLPILDGPKKNITGNK